MTQAITQAAIEATKAAVQVMSEVAGPTERNGTSIKESLIARNNCDSNRMLKISILNYWTLRWEKKFIHDQELCYKWQREYPNNYEVVKMWRSNFAQALSEEEQETCKNIADLSVY